MAKGIIITRDPRLISRFLRQTKFQDECIFIYVDSIVIPSPYTGYFWNGEEKVIISDYDYAIFFSVEPVSRFLYTYLSGHIKLFGDPYVRYQCSNKVICQIIAAENGIPVIPIVFGYNVNKDVHLTDFEGDDKVVEKPAGSSCGKSVCLRDLPLNETVQNRIYQKYIDCDSTDQRWIIIDDKIVCAMQRKAVEEGEFRANLSVGGEGTQIEITEDMQEFAKKFVSLFPGYLYTGIDIITDKEGNRYFLEANMTPGDRIIMITHHNYFVDLYNYIHKHLK